MSKEDFKAGLTDQDELSQYPSAVNPLTADGIDPDEVAANPGLLARLSRGGGEQSTEQNVARATAPPPAAPAPAPASSQPSASAKAAGAVGGAGDTEPTDLEGYGKAGLSSLWKASQGAQKEASDMSTTPPADVTRLSDQAAKLGTTTPLRDASGNMLDQYKPSTGQKIWRGVRSGVVGLATGGIPGAIVGGLEPQDIAGGKAYNAPNKQYELAEQQRQQQLGSTKDQLNTALQTWKDVNTERGKKATELRAIGTVASDLAKDATGLINADNKPDKEDKAAINAKEFQQRGAQADSLGLKGLQRTLFIANGKLPDPQKPTGEELALAQANRAFVKQNGRLPQTIEEFNQVAEAAKGSLGKGVGGKDATDAIEKEKNAAIEKANAAFSNNFDVAEYQKQLQTIQDGYEHELSKKGFPTTHQVVSVDATGQVSWAPQAGPATPQATPAPAAAPAAATSAKPSPAQPATPQPAPKKNKPLVAPGSSINFDGKEAKVSDVRRNPQTDKYAYKIGGKWYTDDDLKPAK